MCLLDSGLVYVSLRGMKTTTTTLTERGKTYRKVNESDKWQSRERGVREGDVRFLDGKLHYALWVYRPSWCLEEIALRPYVMWAVVPTEAPSKKARK